MKWRLVFCAVTICQFVIGNAMGDAGEAHTLTKTGRLKFSPVFSHEGREIIFVELADPTLYQLQRLTVATGEVTTLHPDATKSEFEPAWAADGQCYAYLQTRGALSIGITIRGSDGALLHEIAPEPGFFGFRTPTLAPNQTQIAFSRGEGGAQQIFASQLTGEDRRALTDSKGLNLWPAYSSDGRFITFGSSREGNFDIYIMRADGTDQLRLTDHPLRDIRPRFSPDGLRIAFTSHRDGNAEIYVMKADGTELRRITDHPERDDYVDWHPDGQHLVTVSERLGRHEIVLWHIRE